MNWFNPSPIHTDDLRLIKSIRLNFNYSFLTCDSPCAHRAHDRRRDIVMLQSLSVTPAFACKPSRITACKLKAALETRT
jgi:hypothetical protein